MDSSTAIANGMALKAPVRWNELVPVSRRPSCRQLMANRVRFNMFQKKEKESDQQRGYIFLCLRSLLQMWIQKHLPDFLSAL